MGMFLDVLGAVAGPLAGALFGGGKKQTSTTKQVYDFVGLRKSAEKAGFNPLTALRATGGGAGGSVTTGPALSSSGFIAEAIGAAAETWANRENVARDEEADRLRLELMREELAWMADRRAAPPSSASYGFSVPAVTEAAARYVPPALASVGAGARPRPRPSLGGSEIAFRPDGVMFRAPRAVLDSVGVEPGGYINAGQWTELVGELRGEAESALAFGPIGSTVGVPLWGSEPVVREIPRLSRPRDLPRRSGRDVSGYAPFGVEPRDPYAGLSFGRR